MTTFFYAAAATFLGLYGALLVGQGVADLLGRRRFNHAIDDLFRRADLRIASTFRQRREQL